MLKQSLAMVRHPVPIALWSDFIVKTERLLAIIIRVQEVLGLLGLLGLHF